MTVFRCFVNLAVLSLAWLVVVTNLLYADGTVSKNTPASLDAAIRLASPEIRATLERVRATVSTSRGITRGEDGTSATDTRALSRDLERWSTDQVRKRAGDLPLRLRSADSFEERKLLIQEFRRDNLEWMEAHRTEVKAAEQFLRNMVDGSVSEGKSDPAGSDRAETLESRRELNERLRQLSARERAQALQEYRDIADAERTSRAEGTR